MTVLEPEFQQAVDEVYSSIQPYLDKHPEVKESGILERLMIPDRSIIFRVTWMDDNHQLQVNTGYRVQFNNALGPYKGGLRFNPNVNLSIMKFLAFEQIFKNALTNLGIGGAKGGSDFNPKGKSDGEILRFCQAYMNELYRYLGPNIDVPAGDMGVTAREIGYLFGHYKTLSHAFEGIITSKPLISGGSLLRPEATGYGLLYFVERALGDKGDSLEGKRVLVSGSGNVGLHAAEKAMQLGAHVVAISDVDGTLIDEVGLDINVLKRIKIKERGTLSDYRNVYKDATYIPDNTRLYYQKCDVMLFCATQNEADVPEVEALIENGCILIAEGANMPLTNEAIKVVLDSQLTYLPGKAANAGGVGVSLMEMSQNATFMPWSEAEVDRQLKKMMMRIYDDISDTAKEYGDKGNFVLGANITAFKRVVEAMNQQGL